MDEKKSKIARAMMSAEYYPTVVDKSFNIEKYNKVPLSRVFALGVAFEPLTAAVQNIVNKGRAKSGIYRVTVKPEMHLAMRKNGTGYIGASLNANNQVAGQATLNPFLCDPTMLFMAAALMHIDKKLDRIQEIQQELLDFFVQKERSELKGDLNFLTDVLHNYQYNWNNDKYKNSNHIKVLDIMQSVERKIDFYRERIASRLKKKSLFHSDQEVRKQLDQMQSEFKDYQVSLYLYSFSSFLQVMLLENFDAAYLDGVAKKIDDYSFEYRELYTKSFDQIEGYANSSIQSNLLKGLASVNKVAGKAISKVPVIKNSQIDETLIETGEKLGDLSSKRIEQTMRLLIEMQSAYVRPFIKNINTVNSLYNRPLELLFDEEYIYLGSGVNA